MKVKHVGCRPEHATVLVKIRHREYFFEDIPEEEGGKFWTKRELLSGCKQIVERVNYIGDLIYCSYCDEHFNVKQFVEVDDE